MKRPSLYSRSGRTRSARGAATSVAQPQETDQRAPTAARHWSPRALWRRFDRPLLVLFGAVFALGLVFFHARMTPAPRALTQDDIDKAVLHTLQTKEVPSAAAKAYEIIRPSVVRVRRLSSAAEARKGKDPEPVDGKDAKSGEHETGTGTGVVIVESGLILTSLHVVAGAEKIGVVFFDGLESDARVVSEQPENDLAVIQATRLPDDLIPATLKSTGDLRMGDEVVAVGFPFGIGPSASVGAVSGLHRAFYSPEGKRELGNLIQFDAAANPGNSGGPLVTTDGAVVGIVAAILNPVGQRFFVGLGFAVPIESAAAAAGMPPF